MTAAQDNILNGFKVIAGEDVYADLLGPYYVKESDGKSTLSAFKADERHSNSHGAMNSGALMSFADFTLNMLMKRAVAGTYAIIGFASEFVSGGNLGDIVIGSAEISRASKSVIFLKGKLMVGSEVLMTFTAIVELPSQKAQ